MRYFFFLFFWKVQIREIESDPEFLLGFSQVVNGKSEYQIGENDWYLFDVHVAENNFFFLRQVMFDVSC